MLADLPPRNATRKRKERGPEDDYVPSATQRPEQREYRLRKKVRLDIAQSLSQMSIASNEGCCDECDDEEELPNSANRGVNRDPVIKREPESAPESSALSGNLQAPSRTVKYSIKPNSLRDDSNRGAVEEDFELQRAQAEIE